MSLSPFPSLNHSSTTTNGRQITATATPTQAPKTNAVIKSRSENNVGNSGLKIPSLKDTLKVCSSSLSITFSFLLVIFQLVPLPGLDRLPPSVHTPGHEPRTELDQHLIPGRGNEAPSSQTDATKPLGLISRTESREEANAELGRTIDDLLKWLAIAEERLVDILKSERSSSENRLSTIFESPEEE